MRVAEDERAGEHAEAVPQPPARQDDSRTSGQRVNPAENRKPAARTAGTNKAGKRAVPDTPHSARKPKARTYAATAKGGKRAKAGKRPQGRPARSGTATGRGSKAGAAGAANPAKSRTPRTRESEDSRASDKLQSKAAGAESSTGIGSVSGSARAVSHPADSPRKAAGAGSYHAKKSMSDSSDALAHLTQSLFASDSADASREATTGDVEAPWKTVQRRAARGATKTGGRTARSGRPQPKPNRKSTRPLAERQVQTRLTKRQKDDLRAARNTRDLRDLGFSPISASMHCEALKRDASPAGKGTRMTHRARTKAESQRVSRYRQQKCGLTSANADRNCRRRSGDR